MYPWEQGSGMMDEVCGMKEEGRGTRAEGRGMRDKGGGRPKREEERRKRIDEERRLKRELGRKAGRGESREEGDPCPHFPMPGIPFEFLSAPLLSGFWRCLFWQTLADSGCSRLAPQTGDEAGGERHTTRTTDTAGT